MCVWSAYVKTKTECDYNWCSWAHFKFGQILIYISFALTSFHSCISRAPARQQIIIYLFICLHFVCDEVSFCFCYFRSQQFDENLSLLSISIINDIIIEIKINNIKCTGRAIHIPLVYGRKLIVYFTLPPPHLHPSASFDNFFLAKQ